MKKHDFYYDLPNELIAQTPIEPRDASRMMVVNRQTGEIEHKHFYDVIDQLSPGDCLVINDTRVLPARLYGHKAGTGSAPVEVLLLEQVEGDLWDCIVYPGRRLREGAEIVFGDGSLQAAVEQAKGLAAEGYREIVINGIEISSWGQDLPGQEGLMRQRSTYRAGSAANPAGGAAGRRKVRNQPPWKQAC